MKLKMMMFNLYFLFCIIFLFGCDSNTYMRKNFKSGKTYYFMDTNCKYYKVQHAIGSTYYIIPFSEEEEKILKVDFSACK